MARAYSRFILCVKQFVNIVFYTSGTTGSGRLVLGISIGTALERRGIDANFTIVSSSPFSHLADTQNIEHIEISGESEQVLDEVNYQDSILYKTISSLNPDILLVDLLWFTLYSFIDKFSCKKIFLSRQVSYKFFTVPLKTGSLQFNPNQYDKIFATEPFTSCIEMESINPIILRNRDEILDKNEALKKLGLNADKPVCLLAHNGKSGEYEDIIKTYSYLEDEGYRMVYSTNYKDGLFPAVDYFNAFDLIITGGGYNSFWEAQYFEKEALFIPVPRQFEDQRKRIDECSGMTFEENGADQLVDIILNL